MTISYSKLQIGTTESGGGVVHYMTAPGNRADSYYSDDHELLMATIGNERVRRELGFQHPWFTDSKALADLLEGRHPVTGQEIRKAGNTPVEEWDEAAGRMVRTGSKPSLVSHDVTINHVPKSVSALWALSSKPMRDAIEKAVLFSADGAIRELCREPLVRERYGPGKGDIRNVVNPDIVGAQVLHTTARISADGDLPDPQLHVHNILIGALGRDGKLLAIDSAAILRRKKLIDANAQADLAHQLMELGLEIERRVDEKGRLTWELKGVPASLCEAMSSRSAELRELRLEWEALRDQRGGKVVSWDTYKAERRRDKRKLDAAELVRGWAMKGREHGFTSEEVDRIEAAAEQRRAAGVEPAANAEAQLREEILSTLCEDHALVPRADARVVALDRARGLVGVDTAYRVLDQMWADGDLLATVDGQRVTTLRVVGNERRAAGGVHHLLELAPQMPVSDDILHGIIQEAEDEGRPFDQDQIAAIHLATSGRRFVSICGPAGAGKGYASGAMVHAWHSQGRRTIAVAVAGRTAEQAQADSGAMMGDTVDGLLTWCTHPDLGLASTDVVLVDEAGMLDHERYAALVEAVSRTDATLVQIGDEKQLTPVGPGGLWTVLHSMAEEAGAAAELEKVRRAREDREAQAWTDLREGRITPALNYWHDRGRLRLHDGREALREAMVAEWWADDRQGCMVVDSSNAERDEINRLAQARRLEAGELGADAFELASGRKLHQEDAVIFSAIHHAGGVKVKNGTVGTVVSVDPETGTARLRLHEPRRQEEREVVIEAGAPIELAYARHVAKAQGMTAGGVSQVAVSEQTDHNSLYVAVSRGRDGAQIHMQRSELAAITLPTLAPATTEQRAELSRLGMEVPDGWSSVQAATEIEARTGRPVGVAALEELRASGLDQELAELVTLRVLHEHQERASEGPLTREQVAPELVADLQEAEGDILARIREARAEQAVTRSSMDDLGAIAMRDGKKVAVTGNEIRAEMEQGQEIRVKRGLDAPIRAAERTDYVDTIHGHLDPDDTPAPRSERHVQEVRDEMELAQTQELERSRTLEVHA